MVKRTSDNRSTDKASLSLKQWLAIFGFVTLVGVIGLASMAKSMGLFINVVKQAEQSLGGAIYLHIVIATSLGMLAQWCTPLRWSTLVLGLSPFAPVLMLLVSLDEFSQYFIDTRNFAWLDLAVNNIGVLAGALIIALLQQLKARLNRQTA